MVTRPMPIALMRADGSHICVPSVGIVRLGRQDVAPAASGSAHVSRRQCDVVRNQQGCLSVTSRSNSNPTGIQYSHKQSKVTLLKEGESSQLAVGDRILLLATQPNQYLEIANTTQSVNESKDPEPARKRLRLSSLHHFVPGKHPSSSTATGGHTPDTPTDPEGATPSRPPAQAAAGSQSPGVKTATEGQTAADQLIANASWTADHAQAPSISPPPDDAGATDRLEADKLAAAEGLVAGQIAASDMLAVGQLQPAASLQVDQADGKAPPVILTLCGMPGSGKSTFSAALIAQGRSSWVRVNQDSIKNGRKGSRQQCLAAARRAVLAGHCCVIDRCHPDSEQRSAFIALAAELNCPVHAVVLGLPAKVCAGRAANRVGHEGEVEGAAAPRVVHMMHRQFVKAGPPTSAEGFASIMHCQSDGRIKAALQAWCAYGDQGTHPAELFHRTNPLRQAFAVQGGGPPTQDTAGSALGGVQGLPAGAESASVLSKPADVFQLQAGSQPQQQQLLPEDPVGRPAPTPELHPHLPAKHSHPDADQGDGRPSSTAALHPHLPANHSNPDADQGGPASSASPATSLLPSWDRSSGVGSADGNAAKGSSQNAFVLLMKASKASAKGKLMGTPGGQLKAGGLSHSQGRPAGNLAGAAAFGRSQGGWQDTLQRIAAEPERYQDQYPEMQVSIDCVVINDAYPKARCHGLVIARTQGLNGPADLREVHLPLLQAMQRAGEAYIQKMQNVHAGESALSPGPFKMGFHSIPSIKQLHMHVISQDFDSAALKHKKHWNSFTTPFFIGESEAQAQLREHGSLQIDVAQAESMLKQDLKCHICHRSIKNIPSLKCHITTCKSSH